MGGLFSTPSYSTPPTPPPAPTLANSQSNLDVAARQEALQLQRGRSATMLNGGAGLPNQGTTSNTLLGR